MKRKLELNQCTKCKRTYDLKVVNATIDTCRIATKNKESKQEKKIHLEKH